MTEPQPEPMQVPLEPLVQVVADQRNNAHTELAKAQVIINQLVADNEQLRAENARLSGDKPTVAGSVEAQ